MMEDNKLDKAAQQEVVKNIMDRYINYNNEPSNQNNNVGEQCLICTAEKSVEEEWLEKLLAMNDDELEAALKEMSDEEYLVMTQGLSDENIERLTNRLTPILESSVEKMKESMGTLKDSERILEEIKQSKSDGVLDALKNRQKSEVSITYEDANGDSVTQVLSNPTEWRFSNSLSSVPDDSITDITIFGHGNETGIEINTQNEDALVNFGNTVALMGGDDFISLVQPKLANNATINLEGCNTAKGADNITRTMSDRLPNTTVRGYRGYGFSTMLLGGTSRFGWGRTYKNGEEQ